MKSMMLIGFLILALAGLIPAYADDDVAKHPECPHCGMDRAKFAHSRMLYSYDKGTEMGFCSTEKECCEKSFSVSLVKIKK